MVNRKPKQVVVMGGGTGIFPVISALKHLETDIASIVTVSDSGGSTGRIRDEFGFQPVGDLRQSLAALAESDGQEWIKKILLYRFQKGGDLKGHNLGNLLLTALQDMTGDTSKALEIAAKIFRLEGRVIPVTQENVNLEIHYQDGSTQIGEHLLDQKTTHPKKITKVTLVPSAQLNPIAVEVIQQADIIIIGPGDYYASLMSVLAPEGIRAAFKKSSAQVIYIMNLMTRLTQTQDMTASDHVAGIETAIGKAVDLILLNNADIDAKTLSLYAAEQEFPVSDDLGKDKRVIRKSIISDQLAQLSAVDTAHRSLLRHDSSRLEAVLKPLVSKK